MKKGFTLIELLVVIAIIALLSATLLTSMTAAKAKGQDGRRAKDLVQLRNALELYAANNNGNYPANSFNSRGGSIIFPFQLACSTAPGGNWIPSFINTPGTALPIDPINDDTHCYVYVPNSNAKGAGFFVVSESPSSPAIQATVVGQPDYVNYSGIANVSKGYNVGNSFPANQSVIVYGTGQATTTLP